MFRVYVYSICLISAVLAIETHHTRYSITRVVISDELPERLCKASGLSQYYKLSHENTS